MILNQKNQLIMINVEAFGAIERQLPKAMHFSFQSEIYIKDVLQQIMQSYPESSEMLDRCACAVGADIVSRQTLISSNTTLVLLSPVAGG